MRNRKIIYLFILLCMFISVISMAQAKTVRLAFLTTDNLTSDPRYDYLEGIIKGILLFDLSSSTGIEVVERAALESILREQELRLDDLADNQDTVIQVGKILGADYLLKAGYIFLGKDILLTITLIDVVTTRTVTFSERGCSENMIHAVSEKIIQRLTGTSVVLRSQQHDRSIISLKDEKPGIIALHSYIINAEIFLDDEFVGYTTGNEKIPYEIKNLDPGLHTVRIHLQDFGVVKLPEVTFHDWDIEIDVKPGKRHVIKAGASHFNNTLYKLTKLLNEEIKIGSGREHETTFVDRHGVTTPIKLSIFSTLKDKKVEVKAVLTYKGKSHDFILTCKKGEKSSLRKEIGKIELKIDINQYDVDYSMWRTDIRQNMFRK